MQILAREPRRPVERYLLPSLITLIWAFAFAGTSAAQNPASRPILFAHGYCGSAMDWQPLFDPLYQQLPPNLYPSPTIYYTFYDSVENTITFSLLSGGILIPVNESSIPSSTRFFSIQFYDPVGKSTDPTNVAKISILNKAYELSQTIKHITSITHVKDVIIISHSLGGLDARAYIEGMASAAFCYDYANNVPDYANGCAPRKGNAAFAGDVGDLITVDTPHAGAAIAELNTTYLEPFLGACIADSSVNRSELNLKPLGGAGLVESLDYDGSMIAGVKPTESRVTIQAVEDYFSDVTNPWDDFNGFLTGYSDDIVLLPSQSVKANLPASDTTAVLQDVPLSYLSSDPGIAGTTACWVGGVAHLPMLHFMTCLGNQPSTQNSIVTQVAANVKGTLTKITVNATYNGSPWLGTASYQISGPNGTESASSVPFTISDVPLGTYSLSYISGGPPSNGPPTILSSPGPTIQSGQWAIIFTIQFSSGSLAVATKPADPITGSSATLNGTVNPVGANGWGGFEWSTNPTLNGYNQTCNLPSGSNCQALTPNSTPQSFSSTLSRLPNSTAYYFRLVAYDSDNGSTQYGAIQSFTTGTPPVVTTAAARSVTGSGANLNGTVNPVGANGWGGFEWSTNPTLSGYNQTCNLPSGSNCQALTPNSTPQSFSATLTGLSNSTTYYFRLVAYDSDNGSTWYGNIVTFTTQ